MRAQKTNPPLLGYSDVMSVRPGGSIAFKVSSAAAAPFSARLVRSISADPNPEGPGIIEEDASEFFTHSEFPSREQPFYPGSYGRGLEPLELVAEQELRLEATVYPTRDSGVEQTILSVGDLSVTLDGRMRVTLRRAGHTISKGPHLKLREWVRVVASITPGLVTVFCADPLSGARPMETTCSVQISLRQTGVPVVAATLADGIAAQHFNGKIEAPAIVCDGKIAAAWDFSNDIKSTTARATHGPDLALVNFPARAMTGAHWDASEMNWTHRPEHYAAIHFHDDDIYDFEWETNFEFTVPHNMPPGIYVMRLDCGGASDAIPFFVTAPLGRPKANLCVLVSTFTYVIYGNHARPDYSPDWQERMDAWNAYPYNPANHTEYGLSTYNYHSDGSGICHASHRRPLFNLRPGYLTFGNTPCSGLRHFQADSHLISWLHAKGIEYDIVTDAELHRDGRAAIAGYDVVTTGSHPEYHTSKTLDALRGYRDNGGHLLYLGANGFYWRIAVHSENDSMLEIRRAEDGIRAWAAEPGEYYNAFDGTYGGLWRRNARAPQDLVGIGFAAQGEFVGDPYERICHDPAFDWIFDGVEGDIFGDFGFSGNGAAGYELDHIDYRLGTPESATLLARSITRDSDLMLVPEEQLTHLTNLTGGPVRDALCAEMVHFDVPGGGSVFSTGSITFCGCLPWNNYENNISRLLENVLGNKLALATDSAEKQRIELEQKMEA